MDWYRHYIVDWMGGTADLDDGAYRAYHVIIQLIYQNEGAIDLHEKALAGLCKQHILSFRKNLKTLLDLGKLRLTKGRLHNNRTRTELQSVDNLRKTRAAAGEVSGRSRRGRERKPLENKESARTYVQQADEQKREEKEEKRKPTANAVGRGTRLPEDWKPKPEDIEAARAALGENARREFQKFRDHWRAQPGQRGVKVDWDATWRNWVRKAQELGNGKNGPAGNSPRTGGSLIEALDRRLAQSEIEENPD